MLERISHAGQPYLHFANFQNIKLSHVTNKEPVDVINEVYEVPANLSFEKMLQAIQTYVNARFSFFKENSLNPRQITFSLKNYPVKIGLFLGFSGGHIHILSGRTSDEDKIWGVYPKGYAMMHFADTQKNLGNFIYELSKLKNISFFSAINLKNVGSEKHNLSNRNLQGEARKEIRAAKNRHQNSVIININPPDKSVQTPSKTPAVTTPLKSPTQKPVRP